MPERKIRGMEERETQTHTDTHTHTEREREIERERKRGMEQREREREREGGREGEGGRKRGREGEREGRRGVELTLSQLHQYHISYTAKCRSTLNTELRRNHIITIPRVDVRNVPADIL